MAFRGRCFRCHETGHGASECLSKECINPASLQGLPVEIWDVICHLLDHVLVTPFFWLEAQDCWIFSLRLTCRAINEKTYEFFARTAFRRMSIRLDSKGLQRLKKISETPILAEKVESLLFHTRNRAVRDLHDYPNAESDSLSEKLSTGERRMAAERVQDALLEQDCQHYIERSGTASILLAAAFQRFPNLQGLIIGCPNDKGHQVYRSAIGGFTTYMFSVLCACLPYTEGRLRKLGIGQQLGLLDLEEGFSVQALSMPRETRECFSGLRSLSLTLQTQATEYRNPQTWHTNLAKFLAPCQELRKLQLTFHNDWEETESVFESVANEVVLPKLAHFMLSFTRCKGEDLHLFLGNHKNLESLKLMNLDITGSTPFVNILGLLHEHHSFLSSFEGHQIAQNSFRLAFHPIGNPEQVSCFAERLERTDLDFFKDFLWVDLCKYRVTVHEWEGVQNRIGLMRGDVRVSEDLDFRSDIEALRVCWAY